MFRGFTYRFTHVEEWNDAVNNSTNPTYISKWWDGSVIGYAWTKNLDGGGYFRNQGTDYSHVAISTTENGEHSNNNNLTGHGSQAYQDGTHYKFSATDGEIAGITTVNYSPGLGASAGTHVRHHVEFTVPVNAPDTLYIYDGRTDGTPGGYRGFYTGGLEPSDDGTYTGPTNNILLEYPARGGQAYTDSSYNANTVGLSLIHI